MKFDDLYKRMLLSPEEAASQIKSHDKIFTTACAAQPNTMIAAIANQARTKGIKNVTAHQFVAISPMDLLGEEFTGNLHFNNVAWFAGGFQRKAIQEGKATFMVNHLSQVPRLIREHINLNIFIANVSPMDKDGYFSVGTCAAYTRAGIEKAKIVILEVNEYQPRVGGDSWIHISEANYLTEVNIPLPEAPNPSLSEEDIKIGRHIADLIEDGSTLQIGIGAMPSAVALHLQDKKDLGIHSEMFAECMVDLVEQGVITGARKTLHPRKMVSSFAMGTRRMYDFMNNNPAVETYPVDYTNDYSVIVKNYKQVSINSALEVDLTGQVCSESLGYKFYSGTGGQVDFARASYMSPGGKSFLCMHSTASNGKISRIVPTLTPGAIVTTPRTDVHYLVTEHGVAMLKGKTTAQRAKEIIALAAPEFRKDLSRKAREMQLF
jgi:4-hydroxybutyrate CoA-transferase